MTCWSVLKSLKVDTIVFDDLYIVIHYSFLFILIHHLNLNKINYNWVLLNKMLNQKSVTILFEIYLWNESSRACRQMHRWRCISQTRSILFIRYVFFPLIALRNIEKWLILQRSCYFLRLHLKIIATRWLMFYM
jgi:hypothetical protein